MKKLVFPALVLMMLALIARLRPTVSPAVDVTRKAPPLHLAPGPLANSARIAAEPAAAKRSPPDVEWLDLIVDATLTPQAITTFVREKGIPLAQALHGHPRSGQRLEMRWGTSPATHAVFDRIGPETYALAAIRSQYPADTSWEDLKAAIKAKIKRPLQHDDGKSLIFAADAQGLTVWLARNEDGTFKVACEFGAHHHTPPH